MKWPWTNWRGTGSSATRSRTSRAPGAESLHNLKYWRREPYMGFGADAHSFDGAVRWQNVETAREYVERWRRGEPVHREAARPIRWRRSSSWDCG